MVDVSKNTMNGVWVYLGCLNEQIIDMHELFSRSRSEFIFKEVETWRLKFNVNKETMFNSCYNS